MSKILCKCGNIIPDSTDYLSYKGYYIADQDYFDFLDKLETKDIENQTRFINEYFREIFQCPKCNNIIIINGKERFDFNPLNNNSSGVLQSILGVKWKGILRGDYKNNSGEISWMTNKERKFMQGLTIMELKDLYFNKFKELKQLELLRDSFLRIDGKIEHEYNG